MFEISPQKRLTLQQKVQCYASLCVLQSMVQVETLGELGVFFTLFVVGLEFSPERLRKVNRKGCKWKASEQNCDKSNIT